MLCAKCGQAFDPTEQPGANIYGPPLDPTAIIPDVKKAHICLSCTPSLEAWLGHALRGLGR